MSIKLKVFVVFLLVNSSLVHAETSKELRQEKSFYGVAQPIGISTDGLRRGGHIGTNLSDSQAIEVAYHKGQSNLSGPSKYNTTQLVFRGRRYFGNSFNFSGGIAHRDVKIDFSTEAEKGNWAAYSSLATAQVNTWDGMVGIGNRWQIGGFVIGCDWLGYEFTIRKSARQFSDDESQQVKALNDEVDQVEVPRLLLTNLHIGFGF